MRINRKNIAKLPQNLVQIRFKQRKFLNRISLDFFHLLNKYWFLQKVDRVAKKLIFVFCDYMYCCILTATLINPITHLKGGILKAGSSGPRVIGCACLCMFVWLNGAGRGGGGSADV